MNLFRHFPLNKGNEMSLSARSIVVLLIATILFIPIYGKVVSLTEEQPLEEKLGYLPQKEIMKVGALDHKALLSEWLFFKTIVYYGGMLEDGKNEKRNTEYDNIYRFLDTATFMDPYNIDAYYFAQAVLTWEHGKVRETNLLLERGLQYRKWDFYLPFFLGFNNFYFLKDYKAASQYMKQVALLTRNSLAANLAARYFYESDETEIAITFLKFMIDKTWDENIRKTLALRLKALEGIDFLAEGEKRFRRLYHRRPRDIEEMARKGIIDRLPVDPYGGKFYIDKKGKIRTTSDFVQRGMSGNRNKDGKSE